MTGSKKWQRFSARTAGLWETVPYQSSTVTLNIATIKLWNQVSKLQLEQTGEQPQCFYTLPKALVPASQ